MKVPQMIFIPTMAAAFSSNSVGRFAATPSRLVPARSPMFDGPSKNAHITPSTLGMTKTSNPFSSLFPEEKEAPAYPIKSSSFKASIYEEALAFFNKVTTKRRPAIYFFEYKDPKTRAKNTEMLQCVCAMLIENSEYRLALKYSERIDLNPEFRAALILHFAEVNPAFAETHLTPFTYTKKEANDIAEVLLKKNPSVLLKYFKAFEEAGVNVKQHLEYLSKKCTSEFVRNLHQFNLPLEQLVDHFITYAKAYPKSVEQCLSYYVSTYKDVKSMDFPRIIQMIAEKNINMLATTNNLFKLDRLNKSDLDQIIDRLFEDFISTDKLKTQPIDLPTIKTWLEVASRIHQRRTARQAPPPLIKNKHFTTMLNIMTEEARDKNSQLGSILNKVILDLLSANEAQQLEFNELTSQLSRHGLRTAIVLYDMVGQDPSISKEDKLLMFKDIGSKSFKNAMKYRKVITTLLEIQANKSLDGLVGGRHLRASLLKAVCPSLHASQPGKKQSTEALLKNLAMLKLLLNLQKNNLVTNTELKNIRTPEDLNKMLIEKAVDLLQLPPAPANQNMTEDFFSNSKRPEGLLSIVANQKNYGPLDRLKMVPSLIMEQIFWGDLDEEILPFNPMDIFSFILEDPLNESNTKVLYALSEMIINKEPTKRYELQTDLVNLKKQNPVAYDRWTEKVPLDDSMFLNPSNVLEMFKTSRQSPIRNLVSKLTNANNNADRLAPDRTNRQDIRGLAQKGGWRARITGDPNEIRQMGDEVAFSCMKQDGRPEIAQSLAGAMLNAYKIDIWDETDTGADRKDPICRQLVYLCKKKDTNEYALFLTNTAYGEIEYDERFDQILRLQAQSFADYLGLPLIDSGDPKRIPEDIVIATHNTSLYLDNPGVLKGKDFVELKA